MIKEIGILLITKWDFFGKLLLEHIEISLIAILIAIVFGGIVGIFISEFQKSAKLTLGVINFLYTIPSISMLGFLIPFSGIGNATAIIALTIYALLPMVRNTYTGMINVDAGINDKCGCRYIGSGKGYGKYQKADTFQSTDTSCNACYNLRNQNMVTMTIALAGIASFIGAGGLGVAIYRGITTNNAAMTITGSLLIAVLALAVDFILGFVEKRMQINGKAAKKQNRILAVISLVLIFCILIVGLLPKKNKNIIHLATKPMTEQYILGEMLKLYIENNTDLSVDITQGVGGGTSNIEPAMESGEFDLYPEYTGTGWNMVLKHEDQYGEEQFDILQKEYQEKLGLTWNVMLGFNNTYGIALRRDIAVKNDIKTYCKKACGKAKKSLQPA